MCGPIISRQGVRANFFLQSIKSNHHEFIKEECQKTCFVVDVSISNVHVLGFVIIISMDFLINSHPKECGFNVLAMKAGEIRTIFANEMEKTHPIGEFKLIELIKKIGMLGYERWQAENTANGKQSSYLIR